MKALRTLVAVIGGYVLFALASMLTVTLLGLIESRVVVVLAVIALFLIGLVTGVAVSAIAGQTRRLAGFFVAGLVALATIANLLLQLGAEPTWYKVATIVVTVPTILLVTGRCSQVRQVAR